MFPLVFNLRTTIDYPSAGMPPPGSFPRFLAQVNPAMLFAKALIGRLSWKDALALSVANVCGGFLGSVVVYCL